MNFVRLLHVCAWFVATSLPATAQVTWDPTTDFSTTNGNPNGAWTYGSMDTGFATFTSYTDHNASGWYGIVVAPTVWVNPGPGTVDGIPQGFLSLHPGPGTEPSVLRWTAPADFSNLTVSGQFLSGDSGVMQVAIFQNTSATSLFSATDAGTFNFSVNVFAGDTLNFAVFGGYAFGNTPLQLAITAIPEPATLPLAATVLAAALWLRVSRRRHAAP